VIEPGFSEWPWQPLKAYSGPEYALNRYAATFAEMCERSARYRMGIGPMPAPPEREWSGGCGGNR